jgi:hypothetical protein
LGFAAFFFFFFFFICRRIQKCSLLVFIKDEKLFNKEQKSFIFIFIFIFLLSSLSAKDIFVFDRRQRSVLRLQLKANVEDI